MYSRRILSNWNSLCDMTFFFNVHFQPFMLQERGICTQICEGSANNHIRLQDAQVNQFESETTGYDYVICCMGVCIYN